MKWFVFTGANDLKPFWRDNHVFTRLWYLIVLIFSPIIITYDLWKEHIHEIFPAFLEVIQIVFGKWEKN